MYSGNLVQIDMQPFENVTCQSRIFKGETGGKVSNLLSYPKLGISYVKKWNLNYGGHCNTPI